MRDTLLETSQLQTLVAVARTGSFSKAAEELHVTQSAISQSIKNLERRISLKLFNRAGKRVVLTTEGEKIFQLAKEVLLRMGDVLDEVHANVHAMAGKIRLGTLNGVGKSWLAHKLLEFSVDYPDVSVGLQMGSQERLLENFEKNHLDFLVLPEHAVPQSGEKLYLTDERSVLIFPNHPNFKIDEKITMEELTQYPLITFEESDPLYVQWCRGHFGSAPKKVRSRFIINSHGYILHAVAMGLGIAVVPNHVFNRSSQRDKVKTLGPSYEVMNQRFFLIYHQEALEVTRLKKMIERLSDASHALG